MQSTYPIIIEHDEEADEDGLQKEEKSSAIIDVPFDPTKIDVIVKPITISSLEDRLQNKELDLTPEFQRQANLWDTNRKSRLIESILLKIPLPSFYFSEDEQGCYAVVDGLQRLCAIFHFKNFQLLNTAVNPKPRLEPLTLGGLQYLKEIEDKTYNELDRKFQRRITELEVTANIIRASTPSAVKFNVFARLNQGGMPLNAQEIRNAIFPGDWRNSLRRLAESPAFIKATSGRISTKRQQDLELVLRFVALWRLGKPFKREQNTTLDEFLNATVESDLIKWPASKWDEAETAFYNAINAVYKIRENHSFRKSVSDDKRATAINRSLFEAEMVVIGSLSEDLKVKLTKKRKEYEIMFKRELVTNTSFSQSLLSGTGSPEASNTRIDVLTSIISKTLND